jgi:hypothetical protein
MTTQATNAVTDILQLLLAEPATLQQLPGPGLIEAINVSGCVSTTSRVLEDLAGSGSIKRHGARITLTEAGKMAARRAGEGASAFQRQHRDSESIVLNDGDGPIVAEINFAESPLAQLMRRKGRDGRSFLTSAEFDAGERLRTDYTLACMMPRLGANWEMTVSSPRRGEAGRSADLTNAALASRQRVDRALHAVGPELSGILVDVCCFLKGLETVERERSWPLRSGKMMLKAGLGILARHYNPAADVGTKSRSRHWAAEDFRPSAL